jgi:hypothetical protein
MAITVYPPPATTSSSAAATTTDSTKYSWGTPKLGVCMQLTSECSNLCLCFCCRDLTAIANGATSCQTVNMSWRVFPFGDNCVVVLRSSCWNLVGQVFAISDSGAITSKGTCCELFNWMCEWSCCSPSCCYNYGPQTASCCIKNELCRTEGTDAAGRLYALTVVTVLVTMIVLTLNLFVMMTLVMLGLMFAHTKIQLVLIRTQNAQLTQ